MLSKIHKIIGILTIFLVPILATAEKLGNTKTFLNQALGIVKIMIPIAFALAILFFFWGIVKYIWSVGGNGKEDGKQIMIWGVVAIFVMTSMWGIVKFIGDSIGLDPNPTTPRIPTISK